MKKALVLLAAVVLLAATTTLGALLIQTRKDLGQVEQRLRTRDAEVEERLVRVEGVVPFIVSGTTSRAEDITDRVDRLESSLFGFGRPPPRADVIGGLRAEVERLRTEVQQVDGCLDRIRQALGSPTGLLPFC